MGFYNKKWIVLLELCCSELLRDASEDFPIQYPLSRIHLRTVSDALCFTVAPLK